MMNSKDTVQTSYRVELRKRILTVSMHEFCRRGVKSVKMDDIANLLGISKRTLYEIYSNKEELLLEGVRMHEEDFDRHMREYGSDASRDVIDIIIEFYKWQIRNLTDAVPAFFAEVHKYSAVVRYLDGKRAVRNRSAMEFFMRGVREGYFRPDVDYGIVQRIGNVSMEYVMCSKMYKEYDFRHILHNIIFLFLRGLCTAKGVERLDAFLDGPCGGA